MDGTARFVVSEEVLDPFSDFLLFFIVYLLFQSLYLTMFIGFNVADLVPESYGFNVADLFSVGRLLLP